MIKASFENIIVRLPNWVGDLVMALPVLKDLREKYPLTRITVLVKSPLEGLLEGNPNIDKIIIFEKKRFFQIRKLINKNGYDLGILLTNSFSSAILFYLGKVKEIVGYRKGFRKFFLTRSLKFSKDKSHQIVRYKKLLALLNIKISQTRPKLYLKKNEIKKAKDFLLKKGCRGHFLIGISPFARYGEAKCWPYKRYRRLIKLLIKDKNNFVVVIGDNSSKEAADKICKNLSGQVINLAGRTTLRELCSVIKLCDLFLTNDSGPMHMASAMEIDLIALFGSTCPISTGPVNKAVIINKNVDCSPCFKRKCPIDFKCMQRISIQEVLKEINKKKYAKKVN